MVHGSGLHINKIDVDTGELTLEGEVTGMTYNDNQPLPGRPICPHVPLGRGKMEISVSFQTMAFCYLVCWVPAWPQCMTSSESCASPPAASPVIAAQ